MSATTGNVEVVSLDRAAVRKIFVPGQAERDAKYYSQQGGLIILKEGKPSKVALLRKLTTEGEEDTDLEVVPRTEMPRIRLAESFWQASSGTALPRRRCSYEWRWWPGDWATADFVYAEVVYRGTNAFFPFPGTGSIRKKESFRVQVKPGTEHGGEEGDPLTWPRLPGSRPTTTDYPATATSNATSEIRYLEVLYPTLGPSWESQPDGVTLWRHTTPGGYNFTMGYGEIQESDGILLD